MNLHSHLPFYENRDSDISIFKSNMRYFMPHIHSHIEILWMQEGNAAMYVDSRLIQLGSGDCVVVFPNTVHSYVGDNMDVEAYLMIISPAYGGRYKKQLLNMRSAAPHILKEQLHPDGVYALSALVNSSHGENEAQEALFQLFLARALPYLELENSKSEGSVFEIQKAMRFILSEYHNPINLESAAESLDMSKYKLSRIFTDKLNTSFTRYVQELRVEKAKELLTESSAPVVDIAFDCGFDTLRSFNRVFKSISGKTPREFRQSNTKPVKNID